MEKPFLSVHAQIDLQEESLLRLVVYCPERAEYQLAGFNRPVVKVIDYRPDSLAPLAHPPGAGRNGNYLILFNRPARVLLWAAYPREIRLELHETAQVQPPYILRLAPGAPAGVQPALPLYPCLFSHTTPPGYTDRKLLLLYRRMEKAVAGAPEISLAG
jgi:hypothetical protein